MGSSPIFRAINFENRPIGRAKDKKRLDMVDVAQLVKAPDCGSGDREFESHHSPHRHKQQLYARKHPTFNWTYKCLVNNIGVSPSGKAQDFDSCIPMVRIHLPQPCTETVQVLSADWVGEGSEVGLL